MPNAFAMNPLTKDRSNKRVTPKTQTVTRKLELPYLQGPKKTPEIAPPRESGGGKVIEDMSSVKKFCVGAPQLNTFGTFGRPADENAAHGNAPSPGGTSSLCGSAKQATSEGT